MREKKLQLEWAKTCITLGSIGRHKNQSKESHKTIKTKKEQISAPLW